MQIKNVCISGQLIKVARDSLAFLVAVVVVVAVSRVAFQPRFLIYLICFRAEALIIMVSNRFDICHSSLLTSDLHSVKVTVFFSTYIFENIFYFRDTFRRLSSTTTRIDTFTFDPFTKKNTYYRSFFVFYIYSRHLQNSSFLFVCVFGFWWR